MGASLCPRPAVPWLSMPLRPFSPLRLLRLLVCRTRYAASCNGSARLRVRRYRRHGHGVNLAGILLLCSSGLSLCSPSLPLPAAPIATKEPDPCHGPPRPPHSSILLAVDWLERGRRSDALFSRRLAPSLSSLAAFPAKIRPSSLSSSPQPLHHEETQQAGQGYPLITPLMLVP